MSSRDLESAPHLPGEAQCCVGEEGGVWHEEVPGNTIHNVVHHGQ